MLPWKGIIVHHSLTRDGQTVSWDAIRKYHRDPAGPYKMRDIGYHAGVELVGLRYEVFAGRPLDWTGGHTSGKNSTHLGLVLVGNFDELPPPADQLRVACEYVIRPWMKAFGIPREKVEAHRDYAPKSCPGAMFDMGRLFAVLNSLPEADFP